MYLSVKHSILEQYSNNFQDLCGKPDQNKDMLCIAGLLEVMDSLTLLADTQERELQSDLSDISVKLKDKAIAIENRWNTFLNKNYEIRR